MSLISKGMAKKQIKRPLQMSSVQNGSTSSSRVSNLFKAVNYRPVTGEEYSKLSFQNQKLAKDHARLKTELTHYKEALRSTNSENLQLRQQLSATKIQVKKLEAELKRKCLPERNQISERIKHAISLLMEDYLAVEGIKEQINDFGSKMETIKGTMNSLLSTIETENQLNDSLNSDSSVGLNNSIRFSMSSQERDYRKRLSSEMIRRDFQVLTELSTIFEMSRENRVSSLGGIEEDNNTNTSKVMTTVTQAVTSKSPEERIDSSVYGPSTSKANSSSSLLQEETPENKPKAKKAKALKTKTSKEEKPLNAPKKSVKTGKNSEDKKKVASKASKPKKSSDQEVKNASVYDFNEEDKENNPPPLILGSRRLTRSKKTRLNVKTTAKTTAPQSPQISL